MAGHNSLVVDIALATRDRSFEKTVNMAAVTLLNVAAEATLKASHFLGGIDDCPRHVMEAYAALTRSLAELP